MNELLKAAMQAEIAAASSAEARGDVSATFMHLSRAHIISQRDTGAHVRVHWLMLRAGIRTRDWHEALGQLPRIVAAGLFSRVWVPPGNTGRSNVSALKPMPLPDDLRDLFARASDGHTR